VIKVYFANVHPRFPEGGKMTQFLDKMKVGDTISVKGPIGEFVFNTEMSGPLGIPKPPNTMYSFTNMSTPAKEEFAFDTIGFIAGGSGITPVLQTARAMVEDKTEPKTKVEIFILYANRSESDILCRDELEEIDKLSNVHVWYTVDTLEEKTRTTSGEWKYSNGFIDESMVRNHLPAAGKNTYIFCCGPPPMIEYACKPNLAKAGHGAEKIHCF